MTPDIADGIKWYVVFLFSTTLHEAAHAWSAYRLGDDTAYRGGQVSLDPTAHIKREPIGMVVVPLLSYFFGGWMIGWASAPYNREWAIQFPRRAALMALAGPAANFFLVVVAAVLMRVGFEWGMFQRPLHGGFMDIVAAKGDPDGWGAFGAKFLSLFFSLNLLLCAFNLIPLPPLDGSSLPFLVLDEGTAGRYREALHHPSLAWIGLFVAWKVFDFIYPPIFRGALKLLYLLMPGG